MKKYFYDGQTSLWLLDKFGVFDQDAVQAVDGVSFELRRNETLGVVGESGCGKSTLARCILRLLEPTSGEVYFKGNDLNELSQKEMRRYRKDIQIIFQDPTSALNPRMKVFELLREPLTNFLDLDRGETRERIEKLLTQVELPIEFQDRYPHELSGGQKQRVVIARALAPNPDLIVADEPVTGLDVSIQSDIINMLGELQEEYNIGMLFIAHDLSIIRHFSDRVLVLYLGKIVEEGVTEDVFSNPQHPYTRSLKNAIPKSHPLEDKWRESLKGEPPSPINPPSGCPFHPRCPDYIDEECEMTYPDSVTLSDGRRVSCHHYNEGGDLKNPEDL